MRYLFDVNALLALGLVPHVFHQRVANWLHRLAQRQDPELLTCSITELAFVRISSQAQAYGFTLAQAALLLERLKASKTFRFSFLPDDQNLSRLPDWVTSSKQLTDGHLVQLAGAHDAVLATLDKGIPGAFLIPN